jgi:hypothetical protein
VNVRQNKFKSSVAGPLHLPRERVLNWNTAGGGVVTCKVHLPLTAHDVAVLNPQCMGRKQWLMTRM